MAELDMESWRDWHIPGVCRDVCEPHLQFYLHATEPWGCAAVGGCRFPYYDVCTLLALRKLTCVSSPVMKYVPRASLVSGRPGRHDPACK